MELSTAPGPRGDFFVGSLNERKKAPLHFFMNLALEHGPVARCRMGTRQVFLVSDPVAIKELLVDHQAIYRKGYGYDKMEGLLGKGLLTSEGDFWRRQRKLAAPAFHRQRLVSFASTMVDCTQAMLSRWEPSASGRTPIDVSAEMMKLTLRIAGKTLFSLDLLEHAEEVGQALTFAIRETDRRILSVFHFMDNLPLPRNIKLNQAVARLNEVVFKIIDARRKDPKDQGDLLSMLMATSDEETGEKMNDVQLRDEIMTLILAGHETTANALTWTWYLLSANPEAARRLRQELKQVLAGRAPTVEDLPKLQYTTRVIEESLRLYPPAWVFSRQPNRDDEVMGFRIPKNSIVVFSPYVTHRLPHLWSNPEGFDPDRFLPERSESRPKFAYFPFGGGPRMCIGNAFAMMEAQLVLATVAQKYELHLVPGQSIEPEPHVTLRPKNSMKMTAHEVS